MLIAVIPESEALHGLTPVASAMTGFRERGTPHRKPFVHGFTPVAFWCVGKFRQYRKAQNLVTVKFQIVVTPITAKYAVRSYQPKYSTST